jgi:hypothetical protein
MIGKSFETITKNRHTYFHALSDCPLRPNLRQKRIDISHTLKHDARITIIALSVCPGRV